MRSVPSNLVGRTVGVIQSEHEHTKMVGWYFEPWMVSPSLWSVKELMSPG